MSIDDLAEPNGRSPNIKEAAVPPNVARKDKSKSIIGFAPATLISTSEADMIAIHNQHRQSLKPRGPIEETFVEMLSRTARDIRRLCKYKESLLRNEMHPALKAIVEYIVAESDLPSIRKQKGQGS
jgi:hypothetical protein